MRNSWGSFRARGVQPWGWKDKIEQLLLPGRQDTGWNRRNHFNVWPRRPEFPLLGETRRHGRVSEPQVHPGCAAVPRVGSFPFIALPLYPPLEPRGVRTLPHHDPHLPKRNSRVCTKRGDAGAARLPCNTSHAGPNLRQPNPPPSSDVFPQPHKQSRETCLRSGPDTLG